MQVGVGAMTFGNVPITKAEFKELGIDENGAGGHRQRRLPGAAEQADRRAQPVRFARTPRWRRRAPPSGACRSCRYEALFSNGMVAHEDMIRDKPEVLAGFGRSHGQGHRVLRDQPRGLRAAVLEGVLTPSRSATTPKVLADSVRCSRRASTRCWCSPEGKPRQWGQYNPIPGATSPPPCTKAGSSKRSTWTGQRLYECVRGQVLRLRHGCRAGAGQGVQGLEPAA